VVIAADPLGVGDSGRPEDGTLCTYEALADAAHGAVDLIRAHLRDGSLVERLPPIAAARIVVVGHSMGGGLVVLQQARWSSYDAIAMLGYTH
jgi:pimeloyl-ACP methyl ester carboxylesterase